MLSPPILPPSSLFSWIRVSLRRKVAGDLWLISQLAIQLGRKMTYDEETLGVYTLEVIYHAAVSAGGFSTLSTFCSGF